jgi:hypothetical protein
MKGITRDNWKDTDINVDSLWILGERDKSGKHANVYHGNFIPQIPNQLIRRYSTEGDEHYTEELGCRGCYQYDPVEYRKACTKMISKEASDHTAEYIMRKLYPEDQQ